MQARLCIAGASQILTPRILHSEGTGKALGGSKLKESFRQARVPSEQVHLFGCSRGLKYSTDQGQAGAEFKSRQHHSILSCESPSGSALLRLRRRPLLGIASV
jgi:hypothetical protein